MRCRGLQRGANPAYLEGFPYSGLLSVAPYCVPGGIRVVSGARVLRNSPNRKKGISRLPFPPPVRRIRPHLMSSHGPCATHPPMLSLPCPSARRKCGCQPRRGSRGLLERPLFRVGPMLLPTAVPPAPLLLQRRAKKLASFARRALSSQLFGCQRLRAEGSLLGKVHPFRESL